MNLIAVVSILWANNSYAQENQTVKAEKTGDGVFMSYVISGSKGSYAYAGIEKEPVTITSKVYETSYKEMDVKMSGQDKSTKYFPDNYAFPATYVYGYYETHPSIVKHNLVQRDERKRLVVLDDWIYILENWKDKDNYTIVKVYKKGELKGAKLIKESFAAAKMMEGMDHPKRLQTYLDEAFKNQMDAVLTDNQKEIVDRQDKVKSRYKIIVDSINGKYWNSAEGQAKLKEWQKEDVVIENDTQSDFGFCYAQGVSQTLKPGEKYTFTCNSGKVYKGKPRPNSSQLDRTDQLLFDLDGKKCGVVYKASQF